MSYLTISLANVISVSKNRTGIWQMLFLRAYDRELVLSVKRRSSPLVEKTNPVILFGEGIDYCYPIIYNSLLKSSL